MEYEITSYRQEFLEDQVKIGQEVMEGWKYQTQSSLDLIKRIYNRDDFDPETRFYALCNGELVGFLPSKIEKRDNKKIALLEFPIVLEDHEQYVGERLLNRAMQVLKEKGVEIIRARAGPQWGKTLEYVKKHDFEFEKNTLLITDTNISDLKLENVEYTHIVEMNYNNQDHLDGFSDSFTQRFPMRYQGEIEEWIKYYKDLDRITQLLLFEDGEVQGHLIAVIREGKPTITAYYAQGTNQGEKMRQLINTAALVLKQQDHSSFSLALGGSQIKYRQDLEKLGIDFENPVRHYVKKLS